MSKSQPVAWLPAPVALPTSLAHSSLQLHGSLPLQQFFLLLEAGDLSSSSTSVGSPFIFLALFRCSHRSWEGEKSYPQVFDYILFSLQWISVTKKTDYLYKIKVTWRRRKESIS